MDRPDQVCCSDIAYLPLSGLLRLSGGGHGLVQPLRAGLADLQHPRRRLLRGRPGGGPIFPLFKELKFSILDDHHDLVIHRIPVRIERERA